MNMSTRTAGEKVVASMPMAGNNTAEVAVEAGAQSSGSAKAVLGVKRQSRAAAVTNRLEQEGTMSNRTVCLDERQPVCSRR